ncbi:MAG: NAD(P)/FAD-dependent oxidoreductase [Frankiales bacterium]|nr:NAD(P)/FAD-dependent oxidoreductase [Frankiales bacterium]
MYDVAVIGAGPAGAAAALSALRSEPSAKVLLVDKSDFPRDKSCGDGIAPHALDELARLGVASVLSDQVPVRRLRLVSPAGLPASSTMARPTYVVPRTVFDARLVEAAVARGADLLRLSVRSLSDVSARVIIGADGANGVVRRLLGVPRQDETTVAVAVRGYLPWPTEEPEQVIVMDGRDWPAYAWRFDTGTGTSNVGFGMLLPSLRAQPRGKDALQSRLVELLPSATGATRLRSHHLPLSTGRPVQPPGRVLLAGDAASLVNPLTGEGIFYALLSGRLAGAAAVSGGDPGLAYRASLERELGRHLSHTRLLSRVTAHSRVLNAGVRAVDAEPAAFHALVEVGLGRGLITPGLVRALGREAARSLARRL